MLSHAKVSRIFISPGGAGIRGGATTMKRARGARRIVREAYERGARARICAISFAGLGDSRPGESCFSWAGVRVSDRVVECDELEIARGGERRD